MTALIPAAGWLALFLVYLRGVAGTFTFEDSPELLACAVTLGNTHEPGYPLLCLLNRLALLLPIGTNAFRINLLTAATAAGEAILAGALATSVLRKTVSHQGMPIVGGMFTAALWGLSDAFWWQAEIGDKYPLLNLCFVAVLWTAWHGRARTTAFIFGLAITHHPFGLFAAPAFTWAVRRHIRHVPILLLLICLPLSLRFIYPPVRAVSDMNWGDPVTAKKLGRYLISGRYHGAVAEARDVAGGGLESGVRLGWRLAVEELTVPGLLLGAFGAILLGAAARGDALVLAGCTLLNIALALQTPEKVVRWYGPVYAVIAILAGIGWGRLCIGMGRWWPAMAGLVMLVSAGWQVSRGWVRNDLSSFYMAQDMARNILVSLPPGAVYLGRGDDDLFPLWAGRFGEGMRTDIEAVGLGTPVDVRPADAGGLRRLSARVGFPVGGWDHLRWLLTSPRGIPVRYARTGYDDILWTALRLQSQRSSGVTAEWRGTFDGPGTLESTRKVVRAYRWRGLRSAPSAAIVDPSRPRDEVARDALLQVIHSFSTIGVQLEAAGLTQGAIKAFDLSAKLLEPFVGPLPRTRKLSESRESLALGFSRLASIWNRRGVTPVAVRLRSIASGFRSLPGR